MTSKQLVPTKERILRVAARLFSMSGYNKVTTRQIAAAIGINAASIYYHYKSKEEILKSLYRLYADERLKYMPDLNELLRLAEDTPPHDVLMQSFFHYEEDVREFLDQIVATATLDISTNKNSEKFIQENIFDSIANIHVPLIKRMIELGRIEPVDIDSYITVLCFYCFGAASLSKTAFGVGPEKYHADLSYLLSMIKPTGK